MDITKITDTKELKALAYDQLVILEQTKNNLALINQQMTKVSQSPVEKPAETPVEPKVK